MSLPSRARSIARPIAMPTAGVPIGRRLVEEIASAAGIAAIIALSLQVILDFGRGDGAADFVRAFLLLFTISFGITVGVSLPFTFIVRPAGHRGMPIAAWLVLALGAVVGGVFAGGEIAMRIVAAASDWQLEAMRPSVFRIGLAVSVVATLVLGVIEQWKGRARREAGRAEEARQHAQVAELEALRARTDPHFLFNALNTVSGLIAEDPRAAEDVLQRLSGLFRYALSSSRLDAVTLREEVEFVRDYLLVERARFGDRLRSEIDVPDDVLAAEVPPLSIQPLVENAVRHGVSPRRDGATVTLRARREADRLVIAVLDDARGNPPALPQAGSGTALETLRRRLALAYGDDAALEAGPREGGGFEAAIVIPWRTAAR